jgi:hypothetical protein
MNSPVGSRVGALLSADQHTGVQFLGYGTYLGNKPCPRGPFGQTLDEYKAAWAKHAPDKPFEPWLNPCIKLDSGRYVWGFQCWWNSEERMQELLAKYSTVVPAEIENLEPLETPT